jgi:tetratricopeptide (TPR) repeat protein
MGPTPARSVMRAGDHHPRPLVRCQRWRRSTFVLLLASFAAHVNGAPYVPTDASVVLERVPAALASRHLEPLRRRLENQRDDLPTALDLAQGYIDVGRETSDPRFVSYAYATLTPWLRKANPPASVLVLAATVLQNLHRFDLALAMLDRALATEPENAQAWLTKATLLQVQGKLPAARDACKRLLRTAGQLIAFTCITNVDSYNGRLAASYAALQRFFSLDQDVDDVTRSWVLGQLGEMAVRLREFSAAEAHFQAALGATPDDVYLKAAYADLLLLENRDRQVIELLEDGESHDALLLRLAIAGHRLGIPAASKWTNSYEARRGAARVDDNPHLREHARFLLEVRNSPTEALRLAQRNWELQHEAADVRVYLQAAQRAQLPHAAASVHEWMRATGYEDGTLDVASVTPRVSQR